VHHMRHVMGGIYMLKVSPNSSSNGESMGKPHPKHQTAVFRERREQMTYHKEATEAEAGMFKSKRA